MNTTLGGWALGLVVVLGACGDDGTGPQDGSTSENDTSVAETTVEVETTIAPDITTTPSDTTVAPDSSEPTDTSVATDSAEPDSSEPDVADTSVPDVEVEDDVAVEVEDDVIPEVEDDSVAPPEDTVVADAEVSEEVTAEVVDDVVADVSADVVVPAGCQQEPTLPLAFETLTGFSGSEDFVFSGEWAYSVDQNGNLVRDKHNGSGSIVLPNLSSFAAGMARLPNGKLAVNDANNNAIVIVDVNATPVTKTTLVTGLSYPNGIDVDPEGFLYVAEQDAGRVRRVDSTTGAYTILAEGMYNPNGVSFGPGYRTLYVGSFGGGTVHGLDRDPITGEFGAPYIYIALPGVSAPTDPINICKGNDVGNWCYTENGFGGRCKNGPTNQFECIADGQFRDPLEEICADKDTGDTCSLIIASKTYSGRCKPFGFGGTLSCEINQSPSQPCFHVAAGKTCVSFEFGTPTYGICTNHGNDGMLCDPPDQGGGGGLDGLNVDECGTVYVTEYIEGKVWRRAPGRPVETAVVLPSQWIPNMHWGNGIGEWSPTILYVADRDAGRMFGLMIGRKGKQETVTWP